MADPVKEVTEDKKEAVLSKGDTVLDEDLVKYKDLLLEGEKVKQEYHVGFLFFKIYLLLFTDRRLILIKKMPKNVIELDYKDIELVEFYTNIEWLHLMYGGLIYVFLYLLFTNITVLLQKVIEFVPPLEPLLYAGNFFGMNAGAFFPTALLFIAGTYFMGLFVLSAIGRLRILVYDQPPFDMATFYNDDVTKLIHTFAQLSESYRDEKEKRRYAASTPEKPVSEEKKEDPNETKTSDKS